MTTEVQLLVVGVIFVVAVLAALAAVLVFMLIVAAVLSPHPTAARPLPDFVCPMCRTRASPRAETRVAPVGWVLFATLPLLAAPLGGLVRELWRACSHCGFRFVAA